MGVEGIIAEVYRNHVREYTEAEEERNRTEEEKNRL